MEALNGLLSPGLSSLFGTFIIVAILDVSPDSRSISVLYWAGLIAFSILLGLGISLSLLVPAGILAMAAMLGWVRIVEIPSPATLAVIGLLFATMSGIFAARPDDYIVDVSDVAETIESGSLVNKMVFPLLLVLGVYFIFQRPLEVIDINLIPWLTLYLLFICSSVLWSWDPPLTLRRIMIPVCVVGFVAGIGVGYYGGKERGFLPLARTIVWISSTAALLVVVLTIIHGDVGLSDPAWRLGRRDAENLTAWVFAVGLLVVWATRSRKDIWPQSSEKLFHLALLAVVLLLTKSRTTLAAVILGIATIEWLKPRQPLFRILSVVGLLSGCIILVLMPGTEVIWQRGSDESIGTLSGRVPLWENLWHVLSGNLWAGVGFGAFWSPKTVQTFASHWTPTSTHNGYLELVADVGLLGLLASFVVAGISFRNGLRLSRYPQYHEEGVTLVSLIVGASVVSLGMSWYLERFQEYPSMVILCVSLYVAKCLRRVEHSRLERTWELPSQPRQV